MSLQNDKSLYEAICRLRHELSVHAEKVVNNNEYLTPYNLLQFLKEPSDSCGHSPFTMLGALFHNVLSGDNNSLRHVKWIAFHFDFPSWYFRGKEYPARNWISIDHSSQELLDAIHKETIQDRPHEISHIYAPSILVRKISESSILPEIIIQNLRKKWWLYRINLSARRSQSHDHEYCCSNIPDGPDILCFGCDNQSTVNLLSCHGDLYKGKSKISTLGSLLEEDETVSSGRYEAFCRLIRSRSAHEFKNFKNTSAELSCEYYVRVPVFFNSHNREHMTECFVAFEGCETHKAIQVLHKLSPMIELCVTLINSHVAYTVEEKETQQEKYRSLARVSHAIATPLRDARALTNELSDATPQKAALQYCVQYLQNIENFVRAVVNHNKPCNNPGTFDEFHSELEKVISDICSILINSKASSCSDVAKRAKLSSDDICFNLKNSVAQWADKPTSVSWNYEYLYVIIDGLLTNALRHHALKTFDKKAHSQYVITPAIEVSIKHDAGKLIVIVENDTHYNSEEYEDAKTHAEQLSNCTNVDWIGVSLLHMAAESLGYSRPKWDVRSCSRRIRYIAEAQIAKT